MTSNDTTRAFMRRGRARVLAIATSGVVLGSLVAAAPIFAGVAGAASLGTAAASPANVCASQTTQVALTVDGFGGAHYVYIAPPTGFVIASVSQPADASLMSGGYVKVTDPAFPLTITMSVTATSTGAGSWTVQGDTEDEGYPDSDNSGNGGGDSSDDWAATAATTVDAGCHLAFTAGPATTALSGGSAPISSVLGGAYTSPVAVQVQDSGNNPEPVSTSVTLAISADGPLTAGATATTSGGTAAFTSLANGHSGTNLTLTATAPGLGSATSGSFDIYDSGTVCSGSCDTSPAPGFSLSANGPGFLAASLPTFTLSCKALRFGPLPWHPGHHDSRLHVHQRWREVGDVLRRQVAADDPEGQGAGSPLHGVLHVADTVQDGLQAEGTARPDRHRSRERRPDVVHGPASRLRGHRRRGTMRAESPHRDDR